MNSFVERENEVKKLGHYVTREHVIDSQTRTLISSRYHTITKTINRELWNSVSDEEHSFYVGSYGRRTAIDTSDIDILIEVPNNFYVASTNTTYNPQSYLLQVVKNAILTSYPRSNVRGDGQVVVIEFSDGMKVEILPAMRQTDRFGNITYTYPDTHMGGNWLSTNPKLEQEAMMKRNNDSNGLLFDTCKHIRWIRDEFFSSYYLCGIVIDSFVYAAIGGWHWLKEDEKSDGHPKGAYEQRLLSYFKQITWSGHVSDFYLKAPGSGMSVNTKNSFECLDKALRKMVE